MKEAVALTIGLAVGAAGCATTGQNSQYVHNATPEEVAESVKPALERIQNEGPLSATDLSPEFAAELELCIDQVLEEGIPRGNGPFFPGEAPLNLAVTFQSLIGYRYAIQLVRENCTKGQSTGFYEHCAPAQVHRNHLQGAFQHNMATLRRTVCPHARYNRQR